MVSACRLTPKGGKYFLVSLGTGFANIQIIVLYLPPMAKKLLIKFPTKSRPQKFLKVLSEYISAANNNNDITYLISIDVNDPSMTTEVQAQARALHPHVLIFTGVSTGKVNACNRDVHRVENWDIIVLASDDMIVQQKGWDDKIREDMTANFPDLDGVLYYPDGHTELNTMCIMGRKYYNRFNYIYNPIYTSLFCDDEFQQVSKILGKEYKSDLTLFKHEHPVWKGEKYDALMVKNESYYAADKKVFDRRKSINFGL